MNTFILTGRLVKDIECETKTEEFNVARFTLAVKRDYKNKQGEYETDFINLEAYNQKAIFLYKYCKKGDLILAQGAIRVDKVQAQDGTNKIYTKFIVLEVEKLSSKGDGAGKAEEPKEPKQKINTVPLHVEEDISDEDLPF